MTGRFQGPGGKLRDVMCQRYVKITTRNAAKTIQNGSIYKEINEMVNKKYKN
jgi:hypothetical protein